MRRRTLWLAAGGGTTVVLLAALAGTVRGHDDVPTVRVGPGSFSRTVTAEGTLRAVTTTPISTPLDAEGPFKVAWVIADGSQVAKGDAVARFDPTEMERNLADGRADHATVREKLVKAGALADATRSNLDRDAVVAADELEKARTFQSRDAEIYSRFEIISSEIDAELAQHKKDHAERVKVVKNNLSATEQALLEIEQRKAELVITRAERGLGALTLVAPHDGIVVLQRDWRGNTPRVGDTFWRGDKVAEIPSLAAMEAELFVLEADAGGLAVGQHASVQIEGKPGEVAATVRQVDALAKPRIRDVPVQYFGAVLALEHTDPTTMKPGQRVRARIVLAEARGAAVIPRQAVFERDRRTIVYRRSGWRGFVPVEVTLGAATLGRVVVERGLAAGDEIALVDPTRRRDAEPRPGAPR